MSLNSVFQTAVRDSIVVAGKIKSGIVAAAKAVDGALVVVEKDAPEVMSFVSAVYPPAAVADKYVDMALVAFEGLAKAIDAGGAAAKQNLLSAGLDQAVIAAIEGEIAGIKSLAKG